MTSFNESLKATLNDIDWNSRTKAFLGNASDIDRLAEVLHRIAIWAKQVESTDQGNPALCFERMVQIESYHASALISLALYKPAAAAMRSMLESALYYIYFRTHPSELATLARDESYFIDKAEILEYIEAHVPAYEKKQACFDLTNKIKTWYKSISGLVHSQKPETWVSYTSLGTVVHQPQYLCEALKSFEDGENLVHQLYLVALADLWYGFDTEARKCLLRGLPGGTKNLLSLSIA